MPIVSVSCLVANGVATGVIGGLWLAVGIVYLVNPDPAGKDGENGKISPNKDEAKVFVGAGAAALSYSASCFGAALVKPIAKCWQDRHNNRHNDEEMPAVTAPEPGPGPGPGG